MLDYQHTYMLTWKGSLKYSISIVARIKAKRET